MKRTPLKRKTPLRTRPRTPKRRTPEPDVPPDIRDQVMRRDRMCFLYRLWGEAHVCIGLYGPHSPFDTSQLTLDHVKDQAMLGKKPKTDLQHLVALDREANVRGVTETERNAQRDYLDKLYPHRHDVA